MWNAVIGNKNCNELFSLVHWHLGPKRILTIPGRVCRVKRIGWWSGQCRWYYYQCTNRRPTLGTIYEVCSKNKVNFHFSRKIFIYSWICMLSPSKQSPSDIIHLCQRFFQSSKHFWYALFSMSLSSLSDSVFISSIVAKRRPFMGLFNLGNRKKSQGAKSSEYGNWGMITVLFLAKNLQTSNDEWAGALSWCKSHVLFFHNSGHFFRIASRKWRITSR